MDRKKRVFDDVPAVRERVPLLIGIDGCSSSGKTFSALRLATGIQRLYGGDIRLIDADHGRGLHYADRFAYRRIPFDPPFGSLDFLDAIQQAISKGGVVIVDHMSAEHDGEGGMLDTKEEATEGKNSRNAVGWKIAKGLHHQLVRAIQQIGTPVILLWRAADKLDWKTGGEPKKLGMMPIGSKDLIFEMTVNAYLPPAARGVPNWNPAEVGERMMTKLPTQFRDVFREGEALCEAHGEAMARWALGAAAPAPSNGKSAAPPARQPNAQQERLRRWAAEVAACTTAEQLDAKALEAEGFGLGEKSRPWAMAELARARAALGPPAPATDAPPADDGGYDDRAF